MKASARSAVSIVTSNESELDHENIEFENLLPLLCNRYEFTEQIVVRKIFQKDDPQKLAKSEPLQLRSKRPTIKISRLENKLDDDVEAISAAPAIVETPVLDANLVVVHSIYDSTNNLVEIAFGKRSKASRIVMKIIGLIAPKYPKLYKISFKNSKIDCYTVYELHKYLQLVNLTDICLDDCFIPEANYSILLEVKSQLQNLSLSRCKINDEVCEQIAKGLRYLAPAETSLGLLNLTSNHISDIGAKHLATALRSNRHLRSLNLADNRITDEGASCILNVLIEFPLTHDEIVLKRKRCMEYLRAKQAIYQKYLNEICPRSVDESTNKSLKQGKKRKASLLSLKGKVSLKKDAKLTGDSTSAKIVLLIDQILGPFIEPFIEANLVMKDGYPYCIGNMVLCHLNLSYNNLSYLSLKKLSNVILYQNVVRGSRLGLVKVVIEGNNFPVTCPELNLINEMFRNALSRYQILNRRASEVSRRKSISSRMTNK